MRRNDAILNRYLFVGALCATLLACSDGPPKSSTDGGGDLPLLDVGGGDVGVDAGSDAGVDAGSDAGVDTAGDVADGADSADAEPDAADVGSDTADVTDATPDATADAEVDTADATDATPDATADAEVDTADATDADPDATTDATADAEPDATDAITDTAAACIDGQLSRCWVECVQSYATGCIHGDVPPRIPGVRTCQGGALSACVTPLACADLVAPCANASTKAVTQACLDGSSKAGQFTCIKPLGAKCETSYFGGYGATDCPQLCSSAADSCTNPGEKQACEVHCDSPDGPTQPGTRTCQAVCDVQVWGPCQTGDACWKAAGSP